MTFKPSIWYPISFALGAINLVAAGFALAGSELPHASVHVALAVGFGYWAGRLRASAPVGGDDLARLDLLEADVSQLRQALTETQERLDFTERVLAQASATRRVEP